MIASESIFIWCSVLRVSTLRYCSLMDSDELEHHYGLWMESAGSGGEAIASGVQADKPVRQRRQPRATAPVSSPLLLPLSTTRN